MIFLTVEKLTTAFQIYLIIKHSNWKNAELVANTDIRDKMIFGAQTFCIKKLLF